MSLEQVNSGKDVLLRYADKSSIEAVSELVWNGLDANATSVTVDLETSGLLDGEPAVTRVTVTDNGHGFDERLSGMIQWRASPPEPFFVTQAAQCSMNWMTETSTCHRKSNTS